MSPRLRLWLAIGIAALVLSVWYLHWRTSVVQVERTFARIKAAVEHGRSGALIDQLHSDYSIRACWPSLFADADAEAGSEGALRILAQRELAAVFQLEAGDPFIFTYQIERIDDLGDGSVAALVSITMTTRSGQHPISFEPSLSHQRFVLQPSGWSPALYVRSHSPFTVHL